MAALYEIYGEYECDLDPESAKKTLLETLQTIRHETKELSEAYERAERAKENLEYAQTQSSKTRLAAAQNEFDEADTKANAVDEEYAGKYDPIDGISVFYITDKDLDKDLHTSLGLNPSDIPLFFHFCKENEIKIAFKTELHFPPLYLSFEFTESPRGSHIEVTSDCSAEFYLYSQFKKLLSFVMDEAFGEKAEAAKLEPNVVGKNGNCYVATCAYGSYDCPEVWTLRRFRDYRLEQSCAGKAFIKAYYATSPTIVKLFGGSSLFKNASRNILDAIVRHLKKAGYRDTPYYD